MGRIVDLDDLIGSDEVARECGLSSRKSLAACLSNPVGWWHSFPGPVFDGRYWLRPEVRAWDDERKRNPMKPGPKPAEGTSSG